MRKTLCIVLLFMADACLAQQPSIKADGVLDAASYTSGIAPGGLFVVRGSNLSASGTHCASLPLPTRLAGVSITFVPLSGAAGIEAFLLCTYNQDGLNQLSGVLPSTVVPGDYNVFVTSEGNVSEPAKTTVVARKFGVMTASGTASGRAVAQTYISPGRMDLNRFTTGTYPGTNPVTYSPARPGQTLVAWGTGLGAIDTQDNSAPGAIDFRSRTDIRVIVGATEIVPNYAGRAPELPGVDVVHFQLPLDVETGCTVPFQVWVGGRLSNRTTVAIAPAGADACAHEDLSKDALSRLDGGGTVVTGWFVLNSVGTVWDFLGFPLLMFDEWLAGGFSRYDADQVGHAFSPVTGEGTCRVHSYSGTWDSLLLGSGATALDAGPHVGMESDIEDWQAGRQPGNSYSGLGYLDLYPSHTLWGIGGRDIEGFRASVYPAAKLSFRTIPTAIDRAAGAYIAWGGGGTDLVSLVGLNDRGGAFVCTVAADRGWLTVPTSVLTEAFPNSGQGKLLVVTTSRQPTGNGRFTAPLTSGGTVDSAVVVSAAGVTAVSFR
jgi:uncharacterized protein (TIGR03437 family)